MQRAADIKKEQAVPAKEINKGPEVEEAAAVETIVDSGSDQLGAGAGTGSGAGGVGGGPGGSSGSNNSGGLNNRQRGILAMQQRAGNAAVLRMIRRNTVGGKKPVQRETPAAPAPAPDGASDPFAFEAIVPGGGPPSAQLAKMMEYVQGLAKQHNKPNYPNFYMYYVLTDKLYVFDSSGSALGTFVPTGSGFPPGIYAIDVGGWKRFGRQSKESGFFEWGMENKEAADRMSMNSWLSADTNAQLGTFRSTYPFIMFTVVQPPQSAKDGPASNAPPSWAADKFGAVQKKLGQLKGSGGADPNASGANGSASSSADNIPDRIVLFSSGQDSFINVWKHGAHQTVQLKEDEDENACMDRIQKASEGIAAATDPERSTRVKSKVQDNGFDNTKKADGEIPQLPSDPAKAPTAPGAASSGGAAVPGAEGVANAPAYPSKIKSDLDSGPKDINKPLRTAIGATNTFTMELDFSLEGSSLLSQVGAHMQPINYYWELIEVTPQGDTTGNPEAADPSKANNVGVGKGTNVSSANGPWTAFKRDGSDWLEDAVADLSNPVNVAALVTSPVGISMIALSGAVKMGGALVKSYISLVTQPLNARGVNFAKEGVYVVRCVAVPAPEVTNASATVPQVHRASSVQIRVIGVKKVNDLAKESLKASEDSEQKAIDDLKAKLADPNADKDKIQAKIDEAETAKKENTPDSIARQIKNTEKQIEQLKQLRALVQSGVDIHKTPNKIDPEIRSLDVYLYLNNVSYDAFEQNLQKQKKYLEDMGTQAAFFTKGMTGTTYRPRMALASEVDGRTYNLVTILGEVGTANPKKHHFQLADITDPSRQQKYDGHSSKEGAAGTQEAIQAALYAFRDNNEYGRGTIVVDIQKPALDSLGIQPVEAMMRSAPGNEARAIQHLKEIGEAAAIAGLFATGGAALAIGLAGGVAGAVVAVDSISKRVSGNRFKWDAQTLGDILAIVGGLVAVGNVAVAGANKAALAAAASKVAKPAWVSAIQPMERSLHLIGAGLLIGQGLMIPYNFIQQVSTIDADPSLSIEEKQARKAEALLHSVMSGMMTVASAAQMMGAEFSKIGGEKNAPEPTIEPPRGGNNQPPPELGSGASGGGKPSQPGGKAPNAEPGALAEGGKGGAKPPENEGPAAGGGQKKGPSNADQPTIAAPETTNGLDSNTFNKELALAVGSAVGKNAPQGELLPGRVRIVDDALVEALWKHANSDGAIPEGTFGFRDPASNIMYIARTKLPAAQRTQLIRAIRSKIPMSKANAVLGEVLVNAFVESYLNQTIIDDQAPQNFATDGGRVALRQLEGLIGAQTIRDAVFGDPKTFEKAVIDALGASKGRAVMSALQVGQPENVIPLMSKPSETSLKMVNMFGEGFTNAVIDFMGRSSGKAPGNPKRVAAIEALAKLVGADVIEQAYTDGKVEDLNKAIHDQLGRSASEFRNRFANGEYKLAIDAINEGSKGPSPDPLPTPPTDPAAVKPGDVGSPRPEGGGGHDESAGPAPEPKKNGQALSEALKTPAPGEAETPISATTDMLADGTIREMANLKAIRKLIADKKLGNQARAKEILQTARKKIIKDVFDAAVAEIKQSNPEYADINFEAFDKGTDNLDSDKDVTMKTTGGKIEKVGPESAPKEAESPEAKQKRVQQQVKASVELSNKMYELLNKMGLPPDIALDANFYTDLHEADFLPLDANGRIDSAGAKQITADQEVVSKAEIRMGMTDAQWAAFKQRQLAALDTPEGAAPEQAALKGQARKNMEDILNGAEKLADKLGVKKETTPAEREVKLKIARDRLIAALNQGKSSAVELRQLMSEVKMLEPDAYGARAGVDSVVEFQQSMSAKVTEEATVTDPDGTTRKVTQERAADISDIKAIEARRGKVLADDPEEMSHSDALLVSLRLARTHADRLSVLSQEASTCMAKVYSHSAEATGNNVEAVRSVAKQLDRIMMAFSDAGLGGVRSDVQDIAMSLVRAKKSENSAQATMDILKTWAKTRGFATDASDAVIIDAYVKRVQALSELIVIRLGSVTQTAQAAQGTGSTRIGGSGSGPAAPASSVP
jgi:hypothetical protein